MRCAECKGRLLCGRLRCPLIEKFRILKRIEVSPEILDPTPPSIFVGRIGYPKVYTGPLVALNVDPVYADSPWMWKSIEEAIKLRVSLLRTSKPVRVDSTRDPDRFVQEVQEVAASLKPVDVEARISKVRKKAEFDDVMQPMGYSATVEDLKITENPRIPDRVEKVYHDELKAVEAVMNLYRHGFSTYYLQRIFSAGILGTGEGRKFVPTRWSITAVHSIIAEELKKEISEHDSVNEYQVFYHEHFGNHFEVILYPSRYRFHLIEIWKRKSFWSPREDWIGYDWEDIRPKRRYSSLGGGYYAARVAAVEYLSRIKRQAGVIVVREIKPEYYAPLGVWVVEEGVRRALKKDGERLESFDEALNVAAKRIQTESRKWKHLIQHQTSIDEFL